MRYSRNKTINGKVRELLREGWTAEAGGKHVKIRHPSGWMLTVPGSPSDPRAELNFLADLRRAERQGFRPGPRK